ncbi:MAG: GNAT family N-acetyltransferase [Aggregatilineales bacterium]
MLGTIPFPDVALRLAYKRGFLGFTIASMSIEDCEPLAALQPIVFPTLHPSEYLTAEQYRNHLRVFPEGQFVARINCSPIGSTSTLRINFDFNHAQHNFADISDHGWLNDHDPEGEWLYGADLNVHPAFQRRGIGSRLYAARTALAEQLNLRGQITGGMLPGFPRYAHLMNVYTYCQKVVRGELVDPTLTAQLKNGFRFVRVLDDYLLCADGSTYAATLIVKDNRFYKAS